MVNNTAIHIVPVMNPDGMVRVTDVVCDTEDGKNNAHGVDLDQSFKGKQSCLKVNVNVALACCISYNITSAMLYSQIYRDLLWPSIKSILYSI